MRLNDASGVPASSRQDFRTRCAPEGLGRTPTARMLEDKVQARACLRPYPPSSLARADAEAGYAHHHGRADNASGIRASIQKICRSS